MTHSTSPNPALMRENVTHSWIDEGDKGFAIFYLTYCFCYVQIKLPLPCLLCLLCLQHLTDQPKKSIGRKQQEYLGCLLPDKLGVNMFPKTIDAFFFLILNR